MSKNKVDVRTVTEDDEDYTEVEHETKIKVLDVSKRNTDGQLDYTILIQDKSNLEKPVVLGVVIDLDGSLSCYKWPNIEKIEDVEADFDITLE